MPISEDIVRQTDFYPKNREKGDAHNSPLLRVSSFENQRDRVKAEREKRNKQFLQFF